MDIGCGTGALTAAILTRCDPVEVVGVDPSEDYVRWARTRIHDDRARFFVADATLAARRIGRSRVGLVLNFMPDPGAALAAMRARSPKGIVAAYVWDYSAGMELIRRFWDAAAALDPAASDLDEGVLFPGCRPERLEALWHAHGFVDVATPGVRRPDHLS